MKEINFARVTTDLPYLPHYNYIPVTLQHIHMSDSN